MLCLITRGTRLTNGSNLSTRLPTRSGRPSASNIYLSTRSTRSTLCQSFYNWSVIMSNQMFYPSNNEFGKRWANFINLVFTVTMFETLQNGICGSSKKYNLVKSQGKRIILRNLYWNLKTIFKSTKEFISNFCVYYFLTDLK